MHKFKTLTTLSLLTCTIATITTFITTTASAEFQSGTQGGPNQSTSGTLQLASVSAFSLGESGIIRCVNIGATGFWIIQTSEEIISANGEEQKQPPTKRGPHESLTIQHWGFCFFAAAGGTTLAAQVSECRFQIAQLSKGSKGEQPAAGSIQTNCVITIPSTGCVITIPQTKTNHNLSPIQISHEENGVEINHEGTVQSYKAPGASCVGISKVGTEGKFTSKGTIALVQALV